MPQMAPLMWLSLMILFLAVFLIFYGFIYFICLPMEQKMSGVDSVLLSKVWRW